MFESSQVFCIKADLGRKQDFSPCYVTSSQERPLISGKPQSWRKLYVLVRSQSDCIEGLVEGVERKIHEDIKDFPSSSCFASTP
jgi:hypothetical protein